MVILPLPAVWRPIIAISRNRLLLVVSLLSTQTVAKGSTLTPMAPLGFTMNKSLEVREVPEKPLILKRLVLVEAVPPNPAIKLVCVPSSTRLNTPVLVFLVMARPYAVPTPAVPRPSHWLPDAKAPNVPCSTCDIWLLGPLART